MSETTVKTEPYKSSAEILSELFSSFNAKPPNIEEKLLKKLKKSKKKHKHKEKKHKKKSKHRHKGSDSEDSDSSGNSKRSKHKKKKNKDVEKHTVHLDLSRVKKEPGDIKKESEKGADSSPVNIKQDSKSKLKHDEIESSESIDKTVAIKDVDSTDKSSANNKISIKNLKHSTVYEATLKEIEDQAKEKASKFEEGEVTESESDDEDLDDLINETISKTPEKKKRKHSSCRHGDKIHETSKEKKSKHDNEDSKKSSKSDRDRHSHKSSRKSRSRSKEKDRLERERHSNRREREKNDYYYGSSRHYADTNYDRYNSYKFGRDHRRSRTPDRLRSRSGRRRSKSPTSSIDKKKLLEIARKNAISMLKSGTLPEALTLGPQAQEKVIAAIKAGGKTIEELTDFCKNLSKKEELGELSSVSSNEEEDDDVENEKVFHHPFQLKDKPTSIVMNIKNATPLPVKTSKEKTAELRMQFPVSSGQLHRKTENEWVPVSPKKSEAPLAIMPAPPVPVPVPAPSPVPKPVPAPLPIAPPPEIPALPPPPLPPGFDMDLSGAQSDVDISSIVSQRLAAMRRLQENPNDVQALNQIYRAQKEVSAWAESKQQPGQFTGSTGAQILTPAELSSGYQAWARKDQLQNAAPVTGGMGMHLLQKMGWKPGEGLGKEKTGSLVPLLLEVKLDKKGLVATEEVKGKKFIKTPKPTGGTIKTLAGKHPVSLLGEFATKRKLGAPTYELCFECGPDHKKNFLFKVLLNGIEYKANVASSTKKQAKADAATVCLQKLGVLIS